MKEHRPRIPLRRLTKPAERSRQEVVVHSVQQYEVSHRGELHVVLVLLGMETPDV